MQRSLRVLHVAETLRGGPATYINNVVAAISRPGSTLVLVPDRHAADLEIDRDCVRVFRSNRRGLVSLIALAVAVLALVRKFQPDIINVHGTFAAAVCRLVLAPTKFRRRIVYTVHCWPFMREQAAIVRLVCQLIELVLSPLCAKIVCVSRHQYLAARAIGIGGHRLERIYNGIVDRAVMPGRPIRSGTLDLLFVGRFDRQKGLDILLGAAAAFEDRVTVRVIGANVVDQAEARKIPPNVTFLGWKSPREIEAELKACDVVVMPSRWESFGLVALEAMRAGRPVLASRIGGLSEVIRNEVTGLLFAPVGVAGLVEGIARCFDADLAAMGRNGVERVRTLFPASRSQVALANVYADVHADNTLWRRSRAARTDWLFGGRGDRKYQQRF
ncbi:MAG TPA: glycosyltransferase family 4 protein [Bradyrhizobium sp.]|nr:glycosyltransferase family 4 protein [Bradyrhizobium sp.]